MYWNSDFLCVGSRQHTEIRYIRTMKRFVPARYRQYREITYSCARARVCVCVCVSFPCQKVPTRSYTRNAMAIQPEKESSTRSNTVRFDRSARASLKTLRGISWLKWIFPLYRFCINIHERILNLQGGRLPHCHAAFTREPSTRFISTIPNRRVGIEGK